MRPCCCPCCWPASAVASLGPPRPLPAAAGAPSAPPPPAQAPVPVVVADPHTPPIPACMMVDGRALAVEQGILRLGLQMGTEPITTGQWQLLLTLLPEAEAQNVQRYYHDKDRRLAVGSLLLQRAATSWVLGQRFKDVLIQRTQPHNKPFVDAAGTRLPGWNYNVSHHGEWVVLASEPLGAVGTDVVDLRDRPFEAMTAPQYLEHFRRHLTPAEWDGLVGLAPKGEAGQYRAFFRVWAMKEAYIKAVGLGLSFPIRRLECSVLDVGEDFVTKIGREGEEEELMMDGYSMSDWKLRFFGLPPYYLWCTAVGPAPLPPLFQGAVAGGVAIAGGMGTVGGDCNPCYGCFSTTPFSAAGGAPGPAVGAAARAASTTTVLASHQAQEKLRRRFHVLSVREILPQSVQDEWDAAAEPISSCGIVEAAAAAAAPAVGASN